VKRCDANADRREGIGESYNGFFSARLGGPGERPLTRPLAWLRFKDQERGLSGLLRSPSCLPPLTQRQSVSGTVEEPS
jgi:hypothetical protein